MNPLNRSNQRPHPGHASDSSPRPSFAASALVQAPGGWRLAVGDSFAHMETSNGQLGSF